MNTFHKIAVCSRSFSKNTFLREALLLRYANVKFNDSGKQLYGQDLINFLSGYTKAIIGLEEINRDLIIKLPTLKVISKYGVGLNNIDQDALKEFGVKLGWTAGVNSSSVAELTIMMALYLLREIKNVQNSIAKGLWVQHTGTLLEGKTIGVVGCGNVGKELIRRLSNWGCKFLVNDLLIYREFYSQYNIRPVDLDTVLKESDIISLHIPLNDSTFRLISKEKLQKIKKKSILINNSRGGIVDEYSLKEMLINGEIGGAAFDVLEKEPEVDLELLNLSNVLITPHIGGSSLEAIQSMGLAAINGLDSYTTS